jgi:hypothetical protein
MKWGEFAQKEPELARLGQERLDRYGLVMLATLRKLESGNVVAAGLAASLNTPECPSSIKAGNSTNIG